MNSSNLVSLSDRTTEERRAIASKGGVASGVERRRRKALRDELITQLDQQITTEEGACCTTQEALVSLLIQLALGGDLRAFELIAKITGDLGQKVQIEANGAQSAKTPELSLSGIAPEALVAFLSDLQR